jgi:diaminohydroxyphosphoribosylaminopyrimidine deaminase/5-amino-6-(5-phosphoribosylamino)uracil reductase
MLNLREWPGKDPLRLILSSSGNMDKGSAIFRPDGKAVVFTHNKSVSGYFEKVILDRKRNSAVQVAEYLYNTGIQSLFIEGGAGVLNHFITEDLWDEARVFSGKIKFMAGIKAPVVKGIVLSRIEYSESQLEVITKADNERY